MKFYKSIIFASVGLGISLASCQDLDIEPKNMISGTDVYNEAGITAYMAGLYKYLPMEDFRVSPSTGSEGFNGWGCMPWDMWYTGESVGSGDTGWTFDNIVKGYWSEAYKEIRYANDLINDLESYKGTLAGAEEWQAEARFVRAYTYFALVKRYGGVPILTESQLMTDNEEDLYVARSSHQECIDFILEDLDYAIANMTTTKIQGRANRYVAAAFKSRAALYAGSVARYGGTYDYVDENGVQVMGIPSTLANDYFQQAYEASLLVDEGGYSLYRGDSQKDVNFRNVFMNADDSSESIFIRQYNINNNVHSFDCVYSPPRMASTYGDRYNVTLDWVELFDGLPLDEQGRIKTTDDDGNYIVYDGEQALWENAEPRLLGSIMIPGRTYKGVTLDIRSGLIKEGISPDTKIAKFVADDAQTTLAYKNASTWFASNVLTTTDEVRKQNPLTLSSGEQIYINGLDGPSLEGSLRSTYTGFHGLKWINLNWSVAETQLHRSVNSWIDIRYAEVLLNRAEAAIELAQNGVTSVNGHNLLDDAMTCINDVRDRAGADLLTSTAELSSETHLNERMTGKGSMVFAPTKGLHVVRVERYKELAFEHKIYWDLRRWFTFHDQIKSYRRRGLYPFLFIDEHTVNEAGNPTGKWIYDSRVVGIPNGAGSFPTSRYYDKIPDSQRKINPLLTQNNQY
ncbi:MAG: RagB/SusD family nutrient uptake outer membrane protein [Bacteroidales bacterium]|nr:RagB/SusD family nutrient uptake outer membrane protein [Bacteroidales bacterium]